MEVSAAPGKEQGFLPILLVVDDEAENVALVQRTFRNRFRVVGCTSSDEALRAARQLRPWVVVADQRMPGMTGTELLTTIRIEQPECIRILITGYTDYDAMVSAVNDAFIHRYVEKPFHTVDLTTIVETLIEKGRLSTENKVLRELTARDPLTDLFNVRHFTEVVRTEIARSQRYSRPASLLFIDLDEFKKVNDTLGHSVGDLVLAHVAGALETNGLHLRESDVSARYGGDEFCVLLPETNKEGAVVRAEKILRTVENTNWQAVSSALTKGISLSIGVATYPDDARDAQGLITAADRAMYVAKRAGRSRVCVAGGEEEP